eukprot:Seg7697.1 transcript_id=Seg7697.1/GoldUCD/mRNA.D3Y31 product="hypothetical protein" protein_id=Seg7697.1/GoldUCD/D3Y31
MTYPLLAKKAMFGKVLKLYNEGRKINKENLGMQIDFPVVPASAEDEIEPPAMEDNLLPLVMREVVAANPHVASNRARAKPFKPTGEQQQQLMADNERFLGKVPKTMREQRALEFGINEAQIHHWHKKHNV